MEDNNRWVEDRLATLNPETEWQPQVNLALARFEGRRAQGKLFGRWSRVLSVAVVAGVCLLVFPTPRAFSQRMLAPCLQACESLVMSPADISLGDIHAHIGQLFVNFHRWIGVMPPALKSEARRHAAIDFAFTDDAGSNFHLSDYKGKVVLLNFWASWCDPCKTEIPWFVEFQNTLGKRGFAVVGISMDEDGWKTVRPVIESKKINYRVAIGDDALAKTYGGVDSLPETLLIDRQGRVAARHVGIVSRLEYETEIIELLGNNVVNN